MNKDLLENQDNENRSVEPDKEKTAIGQESAEATAEPLAVVRAAPSQRDDPKTYVDAPFRYNYKDNESVVLNSGALEYTTTDLAFPGRAGLDLVFRRRYDSSTANSKDATLYYDRVTRKRYWNSAWTVHYPKNGSAVPIRGTEVLEETFGYYESKTRLTSKLKNSYPKTSKDWEWLEGQDCFEGYYWSDTFDTDDLFLSTATRPNDHFFKTYGLGYGWRFDFPSVEVVLEQDNKVRYGTFAHLEDGRSLRLVETPTSTTGTNFEGYSRLDVRIQKTNNLFTLYYKDGREAHFDASNRLTDIRDRLGNQILFAYDATGRMNRITDTFGRVFLLELSGDALRIKRQDTGAVECTYALTNVAAGSEAIRELGAVTDKQGRTTTFQYLCENVSIQMCHEESGDVAVSIPYAHLSGVTYPTGAKSAYTYSTYGGRSPSPERGPYSIFVLATRKDIPNPAEPTKFSHEEKFEYTTTELPPATGAKQDWGRIYLSKVTVSGHKNPSTGVFEVKKVCAFTSDGLGTSELTYHLIAGVDKLVSEKLFTYSSRLLTRQIEKTYNDAGKYNQETTDWVYAAGNKDNVTKLTKTYPARTSCNQETNFLYDANYSIPTEKSTLISSGRYLIERYTLRAEADGKGKVAEWKKVYEKNGTVETLKEKVKFVYDAKFRVVQQQSYYGTNLDASTTFLAVNYTYDDAKFTPEPIKTEIIGVKDADGALAASAFGAGIIRELTDYDWYGRPISKTDANNHATTTQYDGIGRVVKELYADGAFKATAYDDTNNKITQTDENGAAKRFEYTPMGKISKVYAAVPDTLLMAYQYDHLERTTSEISYSGSGAVKATTVYTYDLHDRMLTKNTTGTGVAAEETHTYDPAYSNGRFWDWQVVVGDTNAPSVTHHIVKDPLGNVVTDQTGSNATFFYYDRAGNKTQQKDPRGYSTTWQYDYAGRVLVETNADDGRKSSHTVYDALGRKIKATDYAGHDTLYTYDDAGRLIKQEAPFQGDIHAITKYFYDAGGNVLRQEVLCNLPGAADLWKKTAYVYDSRNRVVDTILYEQSGTESRTRFEYDGAGNKTAQYAGMIGNSTAGAQKTAYTYNRFGNLLTMTDPLGQVERYAYDSAGLLTSKTDRNGGVTSYTYDALDRVLTETATAGSVTLTTTYAYTKTGQKLSESNANLTVTCKYDSVGRLIQQSESDGTVKAYVYDANDNRTSFVLTRASVEELSLRYEYDRLNRLIELDQYHGTSGVAVTKYSYDANGNRSMIQYLKNKMSTGYRYNDANLVLSVDNRINGTVVSRFDYTYFLDGNQKDKTVQDGKATAYVYDKMGRLTQESEAGGKTIAYTYDRFSNRATMAVSGTETYSVAYTYDAGNRLTSEVKTTASVAETAGYTYDANGSQLTKTTLDGTETRGYNGLGQLVSVTGIGTPATYAYRPDGLRYSKIVGIGANATTHIHLWDGQNIVAEVGATGVVNTRYLRGINLVAREIDGAKQYYLFNAHGDVVHRVDETANVLKTYQYDAFGNELGTEPLDTNPFRYCGEYFDRETGMYYLRARNYDPAAGRFTAEDSVTGVATKLPNDQEALDPLSLNRYTYGRDNPIMFVDSSGNIFMLVTAAIGLVAGGIVGGIYSYAKYGEVRWQNVAAGAGIGGAIGLTGGAAVAHFAAGYAFATTAATVAGVKLTIAGIATTGYASFEAFKKVYGSAGTGRAWHHVVEQSAANIERFGAEVIQNARNIVNIPHGAGQLHNMISSHYSSIQSFTNNMTVRAWLRTQGFNTQLNYGLETLTKFAKKLGIAIRYVK